MDKKITLTPDEVEMIREDIETTKDYLHDQLANNWEFGVEEETPEEREQTIHSVKTAENILKKLE